MLWYQRSEQDEKNQLKALATKLNKECPVMVDNDTRLDSVAVSTAMTCKYYYILSQLAFKQINAEILNQEMQESLEENIRSNPDLKYFR